MKLQQYCGCDIFLSICIMHTYFVYLLVYILFLTSLYKRNSATAAMLTVVKPKAWAVDTVG